MIRRASSGDSGSECSHPALTEFRLDAVAALQGCVQAGDGVGHASKMQIRSAEREQMLATQGLIAQHLARPLQHGSCRMLSAA